MGAGAAMATHRVLRGWLEPEEAAAMGVAGLATGCGATAVEALWRAGHPRLALLGGGTIGPAVAFGALFASVRVLGFDTQQALQQAGASLATPAGPWALALLALLCAAAVGPLVHHRLRGSPPATSSAGALLALLAALLAVATPPLAEPPWGHVLEDILADLATVTAALALAPRVQGPAEAAAHALAARLGLAAPRPPLELLARGRAGWNAWWAGARETAPPWAQAAEAARSALAGQEALVGLLGRLLVLAAGLELLLQVGMAVAPGLRDLPRALLGLRGPGSEQLALCLLRGGALLLVSGAALFGTTRAGWRAPDRPWRWFALGAGAELLLIGLTHARLGTLVFSCAAAALLAGAAARVIGPRLALPLLGGYLGLATPQYVLAGQLGLATGLPLPALLRDAPLVATLLGAGLVVGAGVRWGVPLARLLATGAGALLLALPAAAGLLRGFDLQGWHWPWPDEVWAVALLAGLPGGLAGALLARRAPRAAAVGLGLLLALGLRAHPPGGALPTESAATASLRARAEGGEPAAMLALGERLLAGREALADLQEGALWHRRAAEAGEPRAMHRWGCLLLAGRATPPDRVQGREWVVRAATAGWPGAQERLEWEDARAEEAAEARR